MTVRLIITATRPSTDTLWVQVPNFPEATSWYDTDAYFLENWNGKGRLLSRSSTYSDDGLTSTVTTEFVDWQALDDYISDENLSSLRSTRDIYSNTAGITIINIETVEV
jgi:hypothetical protein